MPYKMDTEEYFEEDIKMRIENEIEYGFKKPTFTLITENKEYFEDEPSIKLNDKRKIRPKVQPDHICDICEKKYSSKYTLVQHVKSIHKEIKYSCDHCDFETTQESALRTHIKSVHEKVKYSCNQCDHQFTLKNSQESYSGCS